ncbi:hypothetical protein HY478_01505 [Candidatus Uhrbacteria bacterium]|nr:hypothetical protein [Candidatus Uhrbacteria bacterium]
MTSDEQKRLAVLGSGFVVMLATLLLTFFGAKFVLQSPYVLTPEPPMGVWTVLFLFLLVTIVIVFLLRFMPGRMLFTIFFVLAMFTGVWFTADIFLPDTVAVIVAVALVALRYLVPRVAAQNILIIVGVTGIAVSFGLSLPWRTALAVILILALYDIVAVYWTRHMVAMMKGLLARGVIFAAVLPERPHALRERLDRVHPGEGFMLVGTGDLALPAIFVASLVPVSTVSALFATAGALIGFILTVELFLGPSRGKPMPALPPIVAGTLIGFLYSLLWL